MKNKTKKIVFYRICKQFVGLYTLYVAIYFVVSECNESAILLDWACPRFPSCHSFDPNVLIKCLRLTFAYVFHFFFFVLYLNYIHFVRFVWWLKITFLYDGGIVHCASYIVLSSKYMCISIFWHFPHFLFVYFKSSRKQ